MSFLEKCKEYFGTDDLYGILKVSKDASLKEIKKGYHHMSLKVHPDRVEKQHQTAATLHFQALGRVYAVLADKERRAVYDETGGVDDDDDGCLSADQERDWLHYWRTLFKPLTLADIEQFEREYVGSADERADIAAAYSATDGDMTAILDRVPCTTADSEDRVRAIIQAMIDSDQLPSLSAFTNEPSSRRAARKRKAKSEAAEAEQMSAELGLSNSADSLQSLILARQEARSAQADSFFSHLEAKYSKASTKKRSTARSKK